MTKNRTPTPVYLDPGMHSGLEVKGLSGICLSVAVIRAVIVPIPWYGNNVSHPEIA